LLKRKTNISDRFEQFIALTRARNEYSVIGARIVGAAHREFGAPAIPD
jgi:hypothetical protein